MVYDPLRESVGLRLKQGDQRRCLIRLPTSREKRRGLGKLGNPKGYRLPLDAIIETRDDSLQWRQSCMPRCAEEIE